MEGHNLYTKSTYVYSQAYNGWLPVKDYLSKTVQQQRNKYDSDKIIEYLDSENIFKVNLVTLHSLDIGIVAH